MPSVSKAQQGYMGADYARAKAGKKTKTGMSAGKLKEFASTPHKGLPYRANPSKRARRRKLAEIRGR